MHGKVNATSGTKSRGRVQGVRTLPPGFSNTTGILQKNYVVYVEVEQETSALPPKKNPGSAPVPD